MKRIKLQATFIPWRFYLLCGVIFLIVAGLVLRMVYLTVFERSFLQGQGDERALRMVTVPAFRGMITDRDGYPLAISTSVFSVWINPQEFALNSKQIKAIADLLKLNPQGIRKTIERYKQKKREFAYLKRELPPQIAQEIKALKIPGVYTQQDYKRFYPEGEIAAHIVGFTNIDDHGQEGLELAYNKWLSGEVGKKLVLKDRLGRTISEVQQIQNQQPGKDLVLSINRRIQYLAYRELMNGIHLNKAASGSVVVLDVKTGEILAMANLPSFNPNNIAGQPKDHFRNRAVTDLFEPGSTIKTFSIADALRSGKYTPNTVIDTYPGWMRVDHHLVKDEHQKGELTVTQILQVSSNVGVTKIMLTLPPQPFFNLLQQLGFGEPTGIGFPGEQSGRLVQPAVWKPFTIATLSFGYGVSVTALQLAHAYATIANDGVSVPVSLLKKEEAPAGTRILDSKLSKQMVELLEAVLDKAGTGAAANVPGYHVAGKTGTAHIAGPHGYEKTRYISSFVGIAPATQPRLVVAVIVREPTGKQYYGGLVSGPIFEKIMEGALRILDVPPDDLPPVQANP